MNTWSAVRLDALTAGFFLAFVVGSLFSFASWLLACARKTGVRHGGSRLASAKHAAGRGGGRGGGRARAPSGFSSKSALVRVTTPLLDMSAWAALLCVGGGVGYMLRVTGSGPVLSVIVATPAGLCAGYLVGALVELMREDTRYLAPFSAEGTVAKVLCRIGERRTGEVLFVHGGARRAMPAASVDGRPIDRGVEVVVLGVERGIAKVAPAEDVIGDLAN